MNLTRLAGPEELFEARDEIATTLYEQAPAAERSLIFRLLAGSFADEYAGAILEGRTPHIAAWAEEMCAKPGRAKAVGALFEAAGALREYLSRRGLPAKYLAPLPALGENVEAVAVSERDLTYTDHFDEVDAKIAEVLSHLAATDSNAGAHARDVASWSARIGRRLALTDNEVRFIARAGALHEAGESEDPTLSAFGAVARSHRGVLDTQVTLAARIVAVACAFNSALAGAGGNPPKTQEAALEEIVAGVGTRFDVVVVAALHDLVG